MSRWVLVIAVSACLLLFLLVPLGFIAYGVAGGVIGGVLILGILCVLQWPVFALLKRCGVELPTKQDEHSK